VKKARFEEIQIRSLIRAFYEKYPVIEPDSAVLCHAPELRKQYRFSFWDGLIVAAAFSAGLTTLYTEDMQHGLVIDGSLQIINPFG
jgi:predicted nucleic acid-binding protein